MLNLYDVKCRISPFHFSEWQMMASVHMGAHRNFLRGRGQGTAGVGMKNMEGHFFPAE